MTASKETTNQKQLPIKEHCYWSLCETNHMCFTLSTLVMYKQWVSSAIYQIHKPVNRYSWKLNQWAADRLVGVTKQADANRLKSSTVEWLHSIMKQCSENTIMNMSKAMTRVQTEIKPSVFLQKSKWPVLCSDSVLSGILLQWNP